MIINARYFLDRVGADNERPKDRFFCAMMIKWGYRERWRKAFNAGDWETLDRLDREYEMTESL